MKDQFKPDITTQISFIKDAIDIVTQGNTIVMDEKHATILREVAENLIAVRLMGRNINEYKGPYLKWVVIKADDTFHEALKAMDIVQTASFTEYKHHEKQIYVRVPNELRKDALYKIYIEPQINMSKSMTMHNVSIKVQLSLVELNFSLWSTPVHTRMPKADFIDYLRLCDEWNDRLDEMIIDQWQLDFDKQEQQPEPEPDYNGYSKHEEAERMHRIQRDLK